MAAKLAKLARLGCWAGCIWTLSIHWGMARLGVSDDRDAMRCELNGTKQLT
jgi:hypothetical protein